MNDMLPVIAVVMMLVAMYMLFRSPKGDYVIFLIDKDKRKYLRKKHLREISFMRKLAEREKQITRMEMITALDVREYKARLSKLRVQEDLYVSRLALNELKRAHSPVAGILTGFGNLAGTVVKSLDKLGSQNTSKRKARIS